MADRSPITFVAFCGHQRLASGDAETVARALYERRGQLPTEPVICCEQVGRQTDFDLSGTWDEARARLADRHPRSLAAAPESGNRTPGRPRLGTVAREVTLLPRHWEWLAGQRGGASAALRRLVDEARRRDGLAEDIEPRRTALSNMLTALAGDLPGYETATRALFAGDRAAFETAIAEWPGDLPGYFSSRAADIWPPSANTH